ncbi:40S ribosomal protein S25 [Cucumispora dikerogammari]|nr:40S ribosomal protein S25 [Cucumispora dikerogammari]
MAKKIQESKQSKLQKATRTSKKEKKKWVPTAAQGGDKKKIVFLEREIWNKIVKDVDNMKVITKSMISEKYNLDLFLTTRVLRELCEKEKIKLLRSSGNLTVYSGGKFGKVAV